MNDILEEIDIPYTMSNDCLYCSDWHLSRVAATVLGDLGHCPSWLKPSGTIVLGQIVQQCQQSPTNIGMTLQSSDPNAEQSLSSTCVASSVAAAVASVISHQAQRFISPEFFSLIVEPPTLAPAGEGIQISVTGTVASGAGEATVSLQEKLLSSSSCPLFAAS